MNESLVFDHPEQPTLRTKSTDTSRAFLLVLARGKAHLSDKLRELKRIGLPFLVICGDRVDHPKVLYRKPIGKWDAINFGSKFVPSAAELILLNDVDTKVHSLHSALACATESDLVFCKVNVRTGPQTKFYRILDPIRTRLPIAASGELMLIKRQLFERVIPIPPCTAEDTFILFRAMELRRRVTFCTETFVTTKRPRTSSEEQAYKLRTTLGIYQVLNLTRPPPPIRVFYFLLPLIASLLIFMGPDGRAWTIGIQRAVLRHLMKRYASRF